MDNLLNLVLSFFSTFSTSKNYAQMLRKLAGFTFLEIYIITFFLRDTPEIGTAFRSAESYGSIGALIATIPHSNVLNVAGFVIAVFISLLSCVVKLHDQISDLIGIRKRFDKNQILLPLAGLVGANPTDRQREAINGKRDSLMREVFYRYASSCANQPLVDRHDIEHALGAWLWFWMFIEGVIYFAAASIVAWVFSATESGIWFLIVMAFLLLAAVWQHRRLGRRARLQIEAIASDTKASRAVRTKFDAL